MVKRKRGEVSINMKIVYTEEEMNRILKALDIYSRIWMGQYDSLLTNLRFYGDYNKIDEHKEEIIVYLMRIRSKLLPAFNYPFSASYGIFSEDIDNRAAIAYNMKQVFRYKLSYFKNPNGGIGVSFREPLRAEKDPYPWASANCFTKDNGIYVEIDICEEQKEIIDTALKVYEAQKDTDIERIFSFYTDIELPEAKRMNELINV